MSFNYIIIFSNTLYTEWMNGLLLLEGLIIMENEVILSLQQHYITTHYQGSMKAIKKALKITLIEENELI